jgi:hypothetical protein
LFRRDPREYTDDDRDAGRDAGAGKTAPTALPRIDGVCVQSCHGVRILPTPRRFCKRTGDGRVMGQKLGQKL